MDDAKYDILADENESSIDEPSPLELLASCFGLRNTENARTEDNERVSLERKDGDSLELPVVKSDSETDFSNFKIQINRVGSKRTLSEDNVSESEGKPSKEEGEVSSSSIEVENLEKTTENTKVPDHKSEKVREKVPEPLSESSDEDCDSEGNLIIEENATKNKNPNSKKPVPHHPTNPFDIKRASDKPKPTPQKRPTSPTFSVQSYYSHSPSLMVPMTPVHQSPYLQEEQYQSYVYFSQQRDQEFQAYVTPENTPLPRCFTPDAESDPEEQSFHPDYLDMYVNSPENQSVWERDILDLEDDRMSVIQSVIDQNNSQSIPDKFSRKYPKFTDSDYKELDLLFSDYQVLCVANLKEEILKSLTKISQNFTGKNKKLKKAESDFMEANTRADLLDLQLKGSKDKLEFHAAQLARKMVRTDVKLETESKSFEKKLLEAEERRAKEVYQLGKKHILEKKKALKLIKQTEEANMVSERLSAELKAAEERLDTQKGVLTKEFLQKEKQYQNKIGEILQGNSELGSQVKSLIQQLQAKDEVIKKLVGKSQEMEDYKLFVTRKMASDQARSDAKDMVRRRRDDFETSKHVFRGTANKTLKPVNQDALRPHVMPNLSNFDKPDCAKFKLAEPPAWGQYNPPPGAFVRPKWTPPGFRNVQINMKSRNDVVSTGNNWNKTPGWINGQRPARVVEKRRHETPIQEWGRKKPKSLEDIGPPKEKDKAEDRDFAEDTASIVGEAFSEKSLFKPPELPKGKKKKGGEKKSKAGKKSVDHPGIDISMMGGPPGALGALARQNGMNVMAANNNGNPTDKIYQNSDPTRNQGYFRNDNQPPPRNAQQNNMMRPSEIERYQSNMVPLNFDEFQSQPRISNNHSQINQNNTPIHRFPSMPNNSPPPQFFNRNPMQPQRYSGPGSMPPPMMAPPGMRRPNMPPPPTPYSSFNPPNFF